MSDIERCHSCGLLIDKFNSRIECSVCKKSLCQGCVFWWTSDDGSRDLPYCVDDITDKIEVEIH